MQTIVELGAVGWEHAGWKDVFYPETLPEDWRLTYYSNEFRCCLVPESHWRGRDLAGWCEEVGGDFRFFLGTGPDAGSEAAPAAAVLGRHFGGFVLRLPSAELDEKPLAALAQSGPVYVDPAAALTGAQREQLARHGLGWCWRQDAAGLEGCAVGFVSAAEARQDLRRLRAAVQTFIDQSGGGELVLWVEGEPPSVQAMRDAAVIARLLGA